MDTSLGTQLNHLRDTCSKYSDFISNKSHDRDSSSVERIDRPLAAFSDVGKLIKAHTTKTGIAFKPPITRDAAVQCIEELNKMVPNLAAIVVGMSDEVDGALVVKEFESHVRDMYATIKAYAEQLKEAVKSEDDLLMGNRAPTSKCLTNGETLVMVGEVWQMCDTLVECAAQGSSGILKKKIQEFEQIIEDGQEDLESWIEEDGASSDSFFSFGDEDDDSSNSYDGSSGPTKADKEFIASGTEWHQRLKKLGLLIRTIGKQRCGSMSAKQHDKLYESLRKLSAAVDDLIAVFLENNPSALADEAQTIATLVRDILAQTTTGAGDKFEALARAFEKSFF